MAAANAGQFTLTTSAQDLYKRSESTCLSNVRAFSVHNISSTVTAYIQVAELHGSAWFPLAPNTDRTFAVEYTRYDSDKEAFSISQVQGKTLAGEATVNCGIQVRLR